MPRNDQASIFRVVAVISITPMVRASEVFLKVVKNSEVIAGMMMRRA